MSVPPAINRPQSLRLQIGSSPDVRGFTPVTSSPFTSIARREPWGFESPSGECYERICSVIGLYDFFSTDPDRLSFRKHEILEIVRQDESGWWGAVRGDGSEVGWIPARFVHTLSDDAARRVYNIRVRTRIPGFGAELGGVKSAPPLSRPVEIPSPLVPDNEPSDTTQPRPPPSSRSDPSVVTQSPREPSISETESPCDSPPNSGLGDSPTSSTHIPPITQNPKPFLRLDKSLPASPDVTTTPNSPWAEPKIATHGRGSSDSAINLQVRTTSRRPSSLMAYFLSRNYPTSRGRRLLLIDYQPSSTR
jgi:son of sevenless-like protein